MALTHSEMIPLGKSAPHFNLPGVDGKTYDLDQVRGNKGLAVFFICNHCPYVVAVQDRIAQLANEFMAQGVGFVGINSNDASRYPEDAPEKMREQVARVGFRFPYLVDEAQTVARAYGAVCTPDIFVFDHQMKLVYRGRIDDNWKEPAKVQRRDLHEALGQVVAGAVVNTDQIPSMGCSIKWK